MLFSNIIYRDNELQYLFSESAMPVKTSQNLNLPKYERRKFKELKKMYLIYLDLRSHEDLIFGLNALPFFIFTIDTKNIYNIIIVKASFLKL